MLSRSYTPASPLADFIEDFWLYDDYRPPHLKERILPSGTTELVINLRDNELRIYDRVRPGLCERFSGAIVSGTYDRFFVLCPTPTGPPAAGRTPEAQPPSAGRVRGQVFPIQ
jgi:hypothetical protein